MDGTASSLPTVGDEQQLLKQQPPLLTRLQYASTIGALQTFYKQGVWFNGWKDYFYPPSQRPDLVKKYDSRAHLPVRIFFPSSYDQTSPQSLPTLFTIHGGGFCLGIPEDDDIWNRSFADLHNVLVVALNYSKAPWSSWPGPLHDVEALFLSVLEDESLPIDESKTALGGFSAGGNLALALSQLPSVHGHPTAAPKAVVPIYAPLDFSIAAETKRQRRPYKKGKLSGIRGEEKDYILPLAEVFDWAYIPYGENLRNPLICPFFSKKEDLPPHVFFIAAELDFLSWESLALASRLAGREVSGTRAGRQDAATTQELELGDERFSWEANRVKWLLVPDVIHAFDLHPLGKMVSDPETARDGDAKGIKVVKVLGDWLLETVWKA